MSTVPIRNPDIVWRDEPEEKQAILEALERGEDSAERGWVILVDRGQMHELNLVAGEIWCLADGTRDTEQIARELSAAYEAPYEEILADVRAFVEGGRRRGWLTEESR
jgi:GeoRSP system PqqD family protein